MSAKPLMIQGTMSGAGKSLIVAGLCRVLAQDGYSVAPFKSQNMALNSAVTNNGLEMGRAQAVQAEAAGIESSVDMNPILLKPTTDTGSQVIVHGKPIATMNARDYFAFKHTLKPQIAESYRRLAERFDYIIIEGAGSPAEVNLKDDDIVNMGMARMAESPVLLVGDIDRGGVFAQLIGTMMLLDPSEQALIKGSIVNKFRGDKTILEPGLDTLRERMGVPVVGVVDYLDVDIDDEDSMSERLTSQTHGGEIDVVVIRLPKISNFTDYAALEATPGINVRYATRPSHVDKSDLVVLPGTKSTLADLKWLRESGMEAAILKRANAGTPVLGICGGYQMLGKEISDPHGIEGGGSMRGLELLPITTVFAPEKKTVRSEGYFAHVYGPLTDLSAAKVSGYEIHTGTTLRQGGLPLLYLHDADGESFEDGCQSGSVYGTYLHGLFDSDQAASGLVSALYAHKGLDTSPAAAIDMATYRQQQYNILAEGIRTCLDMDMVYRILEEGV